MENNSFSESSFQETHKYTGEEVAMVIGGVSAAIVAIIYAFKNVNHLKSGCCECDQQVEEPIIVLDKKLNNISEV